MSRVERLFFAAMVAGPLGAQSDRGAIVGFVTAKDDGRPLPYADVTVERFGLAAFASTAGQFHVDGVPPGPISIRVRRLGFTPLTVTVTVRAGVTDTIRVALAALALELDRVHVTDALCPNAAPSADTAVLAILQQVQMNAERNRLLVREYPFESTLERTFGNAEPDPQGVGAHERRRVIAVDTVVLPSEHAWRYAPGNLVQPVTEDGPVAAREKMVVPQLVDFADEPFVAAHCFRYTGRETVDGQRLIRVDVEPTKAVRDPDVRGSLYLDTLTFQIQRSTLYLERPTARGVLEVRVDTWFREVFSALPVIDRVSMRTTLRGASRGGRAPAASTEDHRLLDIRFLQDKPD
jgi:hypothetical protein